MKCMWLRLQNHTAVILHGLLGQGRNWRSFGKTLAQDAQRKTGSAWRVFNLDLRCHGNSSQLPGFNPPHTMQECARDVVRFVDRHLRCGISEHPHLQLVSCTYLTIMQGRGLDRTCRGVRPNLVIGHSMGGKVALEYGVFAPCCCTGRADRFRGLAMMSFMNGCAVLCSTDAC